MTMATAFPVKLSSLTLSVQRSQPQSPAQISTNNIRNSAATHQPYQVGVLRAELSSAPPSNNPAESVNKQPHVKTLIEQLRGFATKGLIKEGKSIHGLSIKSSFNVDDYVILFNHIAHLYVKCSDFGSARQVFDEMPERNVFSWTVMIVGSTENGLALDGVRYFCEMLNCGIQPDKFAYSAIVQACTELSDVYLGRMVHALIVKSGLVANVVVGTSLLNMYAKCGEVEDSVGAFSSIDDHNHVSWNAMIAGFASNDLHFEAFDQFLEMTREGFDPNATTFASVLKAVGKLGDVGIGRQVHKSINELGIESNVRVGTALISMYSTCGCLDDARLVFDTHFGDCRLNPPWNAMISGYSQGGHSEEALELFMRMCCNNVVSDLFTHASVFTAVADLMYLKFGRQVHAMVVKFGYDLQFLSLNNAISHMYSKCGCLENAGKIFERMEVRDVVTWTAMVNAYATCSAGERALDLFLQMREEKVTPNQFTFSGALAACTSLCLLESGRQIHGLLSKAGLDNHECTESALIDMYAKCGSIVEAEKAFKNTVALDVVSCTAILWGYAQHGLSDQALQVFRRMEKSGIKANGVTLLCVLFACSHGGMVEDGLQYFQSMEQRYGVVPEMEHYACVVDLLGRVGRLDDAVKFINSMPIEPMDMIWQTLLAACRVHRNVDLGEMAAKKILSVRPQFSATYVLLSNTYIEGGSLECAHNLRKVMRDRGVKKEPGFSWISVRGSVHKFFAGDKNHPQKEAIHAELDDLRKNMKAMGYTPDLRYMIQDVE